MCLYVFVCVCVCLCRMRFCPLTLPCSQAPFRTVDYGDRLESLVDIAIGCATSEQFSMQARESASLFLTELALVRGEELHEVEASSTNHNRWRTSRFAPAV
jgi:hypothetical protein